MQFKKNQFIGQPDIYSASTQQASTMPQADENGTSQFLSQPTSTLEAQHGTQFKVPVTPDALVSVATTLDARQREQVLSYADWLASQAKYHATNDSTQEINNYIQDASKIVQVGAREIATFAPFRPELSALQTFTTKQVVALCILGLLWLVSSILFPLHVLTIIISAITLMYSSNIILNMIMALRTSRGTSEEHIDDDVVHALRTADWPMYTILCPLYREAAVVPQFVQSMRALDYPADKLQILFLTEEDDKETRDAIRALGLPPHFSIIIVPDGKPRTKPRACNYGLMMSNGAYVVIYDAEDIPDPLQLKKAVLSFANHTTDVVCVQAKLNFYNAYQNLLTRWFTIEYSTWFDLILPGLQQLGFSLPLGGTSNHFRTSALRALGGWDAYNVTEDCDLGLRLSRYHMKTVVLDSTTLEEANPQVKNWIRQRSRWIKGYMQTYLVHMRHPLTFFREGRLYDMFSFQTVVGSGTGVFFINPFMWLLLAIYMVMGQRVVEIYHLLFPGPMLYLAAFCLIFGNFFYIYIHLLGCAKRKQYRLLLWALFLPLYWSLMSVAGMLALFELLVKPHYWQKTVHGLHLQGKQAAPIASQQPVAFEPEQSLQPQTPSIPRSISRVKDIPTVTSSLKAIMTLPMPAISSVKKQVYESSHRAQVRDLWLVATVILACIASISACWYYFQQHELLLYQDALSHMRISRSVFDSVTPGIAQLGTVWLPLPHILMWPFIWNDYLWHSGLAGSFVSMPCYVITAIYLFLSARKVTHSSIASFIGTLAFIFNPNILYLQSTPLSETVCIATLAMTCYFFLCWIENGENMYMIVTAGSCFLATLARYDGWVLFMALFCFIPIIGLLKHKKFMSIQSDMVLFSVLGGFGIGLWFIWNQIIFGDFLYFQRSEYSSQAQQMVQLQHNMLFTYHNIWQSIRYYTIDSMQTVGTLLFVIAVIALFLYIIRYRLNPTTLGVLAFCTPFLLYVVSLYTGNAILWIPGATTQNAHVYMYNVRYGSQIVAPVALCISLLSSFLSKIPYYRYRYLLNIILISIIFIQSISITTQGIITLQDGTYNHSCAAYESTIINYLVAHYNGGKILQDVYATGFDASEAGINFSNVIYEGSGQVWIQALHNPANLADWIIVKPGAPLDIVSRHINIASPGFLDQFTPVVQTENGVFLYHRINGMHLANRPVPLPLTFAHYPCIKG